MDFINNKNLYYLKRTGSKKQYKYWYWCQKLQSIMPYPQPRDKSLILKCPQYKADPRIDKRELQIGDIVFCFAIREFAILICQNMDNWDIETRSGLLHTVNQEDLILVSPNIFLGKKIKIEPNLVNAKTQEELDFAERLGEIDVFDDIASRLSEIPLTKETFKELHRIWFQKVYIWAGAFREEPIYVGNHNSETLPWEQIGAEIEHLFDRFNRLLKEETGKILLEALLNLHVDLAWIHPFKDGNGRIIRYFSNLVALQFSYELNWNLETSRKKSQYHKAVRRAINGNQKDLRIIILKSLNEIA